MRRLVVAALLAVACCAHGDRPERPPLKLDGVVIRLNILPPLPVDQVMQGCRLWERFGAKCELSPLMSAIQVAPMDCRPDAVAFMIGRRWSSETWVMYLSPDPCPWADSKQLPVTVGHEIGHWLGLDHAAKGTIMAAVVNNMASAVTSADYAALPCSVAIPQRGDAGADYRDSDGNKSD